MFIEFEKKSGVARYGSGVCCYEDFDTFKKAFHAFVKVSRKCFETPPRKISIKKRLCFYRLYVLT